MNSFGIILGEPNSINSELLAKSKAYKSKVVVIGSYDLLKSQLKILNIKRKLNKIKTFKKIKRPNGILNILDIPLKFKDAFNINPVNSSAYIKKCLDTGHNLCSQKKIKGIINYHI